MTRSQYALLIIALTILCMGCIFIGKAIGETITVKEVSQVNTININPKHTTCFLFDMSKSGWKLVTEKNRYWVSEQVSLGKIEWREMETTTCFRRYPDRSLGEKIILRNEWYHAKRYR